MTNLLIKALSIIALVASSFLAPTTFAASLAVSLATAFGKKVYHQHSTFSLLTCLICFYLFASTAFNYLFVLSTSFVLFAILDFIFIF